MMLKPDTRIQAEVLPIFHRIPTMATQSELILHRTR